MEWKPDRRLQARMAVVIVLLMLLELILMPTLGYAIVKTYSLYFPSSPETGFMTVVAGITGCAFIAQLIVGHQLALRAVDAEPVGEDAYPDTSQRLARLAQQADIPTPELAVSQSKVPTSLATGRSQTGSTVVVTEGLLETVEGPELDAVLAHEIAHIKNRDAAVMSIAYLLPTFTYATTTAAREALEAIPDAHKDLLKCIERIVEFYKENKGKTAAVLALGASSVVVFVYYLLSIATAVAVVTVIISVVFWLVSFLLFRLLSRERERAADRGAARITGDPLSLASALATITDEQSKLPDRDLREMDGGVRALYVSPIDTPMFTDGDVTLVDPDHFPEPHPPTEDRIERLQRLATQQETH